MGLAAWGIQGLEALQPRPAVGSHRGVPSPQQGMRPIDEARIQTNLAEALARLEAMRVMNARMAWDLDQGEMNPALASALKYFPPRASSRCVAC